MRPHTKKREKEGSRGEEMREEKESDFLLLRLSVCLSVCDVRRLLVLALLLLLVGGKRGKEKETRSVDI